jgi:hypothetical protein
MDEKKRATNNAIEVLRALKKYHPEMSNHIDAFIGSLAAGSPLTPDQKAQAAIAKAQDDAVQAAAQPPSQQPPPVAPAPPPMPSAPPGP